ncbi:hypothetical protein POSPLADRAFT_1044158 [Postia placenta MAD-698-R-SB12]|uniref:Cytochrome P450 n=2 Tax=Rhodonia placenta TaxID=104341 RepID=A0A1X6N844_9APHY|nr:hypothetical protein POSPLADRAFT_1044158 [Postia placenta MAD-698-R-SB12]OSX64670.1 hypothetical protein POSPLADRAFT_1044158 [Postia placenta MAD-698-R-SB12]BAK09369.1 cytochrome P450 [Postia placenta]
MSAAEGSNVFSSWHSIGIVVLLAVLYWAAHIVLSQRNSAIPAVGPQWLKGLTVVTRHREQLLWACSQYPDRLIRIPIFPFGGAVVANGSKLINEIRTGPDDTFSPKGAVEKFIQSAYTTGSIVAETALHKPIIRNQFTRNADSVFLDLMDEIVFAFDNVLHLPESQEWVSFPALDTFVQVLAGCTNRVFVGLPLCRNREYQQIVTNYATQVVKSAYIINMFPDWCHPVIGRLVTRPQKYVEKLIGILGPTIDERWKSYRVYGKEWVDKPDDFLMWVMQDASPGYLQSNEVLVTYVLFINFASIHTTSMQFTHAMYDLASHPECVEPLRDEARATLRDHGWTKTAMEQMRKLDSFMRESARMGPTNLVSLPRKLLRDWTFSDGTMVKKGTYMGASTFSVHFDEDKYANARIFDPWRFCKDEKSSDKLVASSTEFLAFGAGKHACPGRFFAANEMKALLCFVLLNMDIKLMDGKGRPTDEYFGNSIIPNRSAHLLFRRLECGERPRMMAS